MKLAIRVTVWLPFDWIRFADTPALTTWYIGDGANRGFNPDSSNYRLAQQLNLTFNDITGRCTDAYYYHNTGLSQRKTLEKNLTPPRTIISNMKASTDGLNYTVISNTDKVDEIPGTHKFKLKGSVAEPFQWYAPNIDYEYTITAHSNGLVQVKGEHDGFPNYEIFKKIDNQPWLKIYGWDGPNEGKTLNNLFAPMDVTVQRGG